MAASWILAYFRSVYRAKLDITAEGLVSIPISEEAVDVESLHLAVSDDLIHWTALNDNRPVLATGSPRLRDPFVVRDPRGGFHCVGTGGGSHSLLHAYSPDLIDWSQLESHRVMPTDARVANVWAPKCVADPSGDWFVTWSSSYGAHGWDDSRIWCARTSDFQHFSEPRILFDPGFTVIDALVVNCEGHWRMVFKDERFGHVHGEHRYLQMAESESIDGPYRIVGGRITPGIAEGPALVRHPDGRWFLFHDQCMDNLFGVLASHDMRAWTPVLGATFPQHARHGSVVEIAAAERARLAAAWSRPR